MLRWCKMYVDFLLNACSLKDNVFLFICKRCPNMFLNERLLSSHIINLLTSFLLHMAILLSKFYDIVAHTQVNFIHNFLIHTDFMLKKTSTKQIKPFLETRRPKNFYSINFQFMWCNPRGSIVVSVELCRRVDQNPLLKFSIRMILISSIPSTNDNLAFSLIVVLGIETQKWARLLQITLS